MKSKTIIIGDTHGSFPLILQEKNLTAFHVGDFAAGFPSMNYWKLCSINDALKNNNSHIYVNRGNHDDPAVWRQRNPKLSNLHFVDSYQAVQHGEDVYLFLGGAISVDRTERTLGITYWKDEGFDYLDGLDISCKNLEGVTYVISHTAPSSCWPVGFNSICHHYAKRDRFLLDELAAERDSMSLVRDCIVKSCPKLKHWYYGHFHPQKNVTEGLFTCLAINDYVEIG